MYYVSCEVSLCCLLASMVSVKSPAIATLYLAAFKMSYLSIFSSFTLCFGVIFSAFVLLKVLQGPLDLWFAFDPFGENS